MVVTFSNITNNSATSEWGQVAEAAQYRAEVGTDGVVPDWIELVNAPAHSMVISSLPSGTTHYVRVTPVDSAGNHLVSLRSPWTQFTTL